jgi:hypothetical protein
MNFREYSNISLRAFVFSTKQQEVIDRKHDILSAVYAHHAISPASILFMGFNPAIFACKSPKITVADINSEAQQLLTNAGIKFDVVNSEDLFNYKKNFDVVVAVEEYFTFAESDEDQKTKFDMICNLARKLVITTLRDYKNQEFKDREFSLPAVIKNDQSTRFYIEHHDYDTHDRNMWIRSIYEITGNEMVPFTGFCCRHMFFKQCAKFGFDAGAKDFLVHKNLMYKSLLKKNYEHVISIKFG